MKTLLMQATNFLNGMLTISRISMRGYGIVKKTFRKKTDDKKYQQQ
jgi:hypothetical protein